VLFLQIIKSVRIPKYKKVKICGIIKEKINISVTQSWYGIELEVLSVGSPLVQM